LVIIGILILTDSFRVLSGYIMYLFHFKGV
jgi:hypothetical protein